MFRTLLSIIGLGMVSMPDRVVETAESVAFENPEDAILREWTIPMARLEGVGYLFLARRTRFRSGILGVIFGLVGSLAAVAPRQYLTVGLSLAYENPDDISVKSWVIPATRVVGLSALVLTVTSLRGGDGD